MPNNHIKVWEETVNDNANYLLTLLDADSAFGHQSHVVPPHLVAVPQNYPPQAQRSLYGEDGEQGGGEVGSVPAGGRSGDPSSFLALTPTNCQVMSI